MTPTEQYVAELRRRGYEVDGYTMTIRPPSTPQRQTQAIGEHEYNYLDDRSVPNGWLPEDMRLDTARKMRALANRRIPFTQVCPNSTPDEVIAMAGSMMLADIMMQDATARGRRFTDLDPNTEL